MPDNKYIEIICEYIVKLYLDCKLNNDKYINKIEL